MDLQSSCVHFDVYKWTYVTGGNLFISKIVDQNMIDDENKKKQEAFKVIGGDILRENKNINKRLRWGHI